MTVRPIIRPDNPVLRKRAHKVTSYGASFQRLVDDMLDTLNAAAGVGLAAPQIAVAQRLFIARLPDDEDSREEYGENAGVLYVIANPEYVKVSRTMVEGVEACLSIPGYYGLVDRHEQIIVRGFDREGRPVRHKVSGWLARVFQHEIDHLDGRLYIDIAREMWQEKDEQQGTEAQADSAPAAQADPAPPKE